VKKGENFREKYLTSMDASPSLFFFKQKRVVVVTSNEGFKKRMALSKNWGRLSTQTRFFAPRVR